MGYGVKYGDILKRAESLKTAKLELMPLSSALKFHPLLSNEKV